MDWMVATGTVVALAGATHFMGCVDTAGDCTLIGTCGGGGAGATSSSDTTTTTSSSSSAATTSSSSSSGSTGGGGAAPVSLCQSRHYGDTQDQAARSIYVDKASQVLFAGEFQGTLTVGGASATATGKDVFVAKVSSAWETAWLEHLAVNYGAVAYQPTGEVILAGSYAGLVDVGCTDPLPAGDNLYVVKLGGDGACVWAKSFNAPGAHVSLAVDATGKISLAADAQGTFDLHNGASAPLGVATSGGRDIFAISLDSDGKILGAVALGGTADDVVNAVAADAAGGMVIAGSLKSDKPDFGGTGKNPPESNGILAQAFAARIKGNAVSWAIGFPGDGDQAATAVAVVGTVATVAGHFTGTMKLDDHTSLTAKDDDLFVLGLEGTTDVSVAWSKAFHGEGEATIASLAASATGALALTGSLAGDIDFGLGQLSAKQGVYYAKLAASDGKGLASYAFGAGDPALTAGGVALDGSGLYVAGSFGVPLDLGDKSPLQIAGGTDLFVAKFCLP